MKKRLLVWMTALCLLAAPVLAENEAQLQSDAPVERIGRPMDMDGAERGERPEGMENGGGRGQGGAGGMATSEPDEALQAILDEVQEKYQLLTFTDPETGFEMQYELFVPEDYSEENRYPMIMFIPDSRAAGREPAFSLTIGWGGVVWATAQEQAKHPCFVLIPVFTETVVDDNFNTSDQIDTAVRLIESLTQTYAIDTDRLYTTASPWAA